MAAFWGFVDFASFLGCIVILAVSSAKWETLKRMIIALVAVAVGIFVIGGLAASILHSGTMWYLTGALMVSCSIPAAAIAGTLHMRVIKNQ